MAATKTHNEIEIHPPHGAKFTPSHASFVYLQFPRGQERQIVEWLQGQLDNVIAPEMHKHEAMVKKKMDFENSPEAVQEKLREFAPQVVAQLDALPTTKINEPVQCNNCGSYSPGEADFCMKCGTSVLPAAQAARETQPTA